MPRQGGTPLWIGPEVPQSVPPCELCGQERVFEFQINPQLLQHLALDSSVDDGVDWGVLAVYTCTAR